MAAMLLALGNERAGLPYSEKSPSGTQKLGAISHRGPGLDLSPGAIVATHIGCLMPFPHPGARALRHGGIALRPSLPQDPPLPASLQALLFLQ